MRGRPAWKWHDAATGYDRSSQRRREHERLVGQVPDQHARRVEIVEHEQCAGDQLDLTNVTSTKLKALKFAAGKLTVTDGTHSATISFTGAIAATNFTVLGSDGHGGTIIGWHS